MIKDIQAQVTKIGLKLRSLNLSDWGSIASIGGALILVCNKIKKKKS